MKCYVILCFFWFQIPCLAKMWESVILAPFSSGTSLRNKAVFDILLQL